MENGFVKVEDTVTKNEKIFFICSLVSIQPYLPLHQNKSCITLPHTETFAQKVWKGPKWSFAKFLYGCDPVLNFMILQ